MENSSVEVCFIRWLRRGVALPHKGDTHKTRRRRGTSPHTASDAARQRAHARVGGRAPHLTTPAVAASRRGAAAAPRNGRRGRPPHPVLPTGRPHPGLAGQAVCGRVHRRVGGVPDVHRLRPRPVRRLLPGPARQRAGLLPHGLARRLVDADAGRPEAAGRPAGLPPLAGRARAAHRPPHRLLRLPDHAVLLGHGADAPAHRRRRPGRAPPRPVGVGLGGGAPPRARVVHTGRARRAPGRRPGAPRVRPGCRPRRPRRRRRRGPSRGHWRFGGGRGRRAQRGGRVVGAGRRAPEGGGGGGGGGAVAWPPPARENWGDAAAAALGAALAAGADEVRLSLTDIARHHAARPPDAADPVARAAVAERVAALRRAAQGAARAAMEDSTAAARARRASARRREAPLPLPPPPPPTVEVSVHASELAAKVGAAAAGGGGRAAAVAGLDGSTASGHRHRRPLFNRVRSVARTVLGTRPDAAVRFVLRTHIAVALLAGGLWAGAALALALDSKTPGPAGEARRTRWAAVLLAPFGCILRWRLAPLNYRLRGRWRALPAGTLAANALGCLATALLSVVAVRALPPASPAVPAHSWGRVWTRAAQAGFCGALSTVSTFMAETGAQLRRVPADASGYAYVGLTWAVAVVVTVIAYGPAVWA